MMVITVEIRFNYGIRAIYPECHTARLLAALAGTKTFTPASLETIRRLGYEITVKQQQI